MSSTLKRELCPRCQKRNLCTYTHMNQERQRCMTEGCSTMTQVPAKQPTFVDSATLEFNYPTKPYRGISVDICRYLGIKVSELGDTQIVSYDHNNLDGSFSLKRRYPNPTNPKKKVYDWSPRAEETTLWGLDKCNDFDKPVYITEGSEDAATLWDIGFQACSVLSAGDLLPPIELSLERLNKYPEIILCIESDKAGKAVQSTLRDILKHKLLRTVDLSPRKDANEWIREDLELEPDRAELRKRVNDAKEIIPEGIVFGSGLDQQMLWSNPPTALPFPWPKLTDSMIGLERGQLYGIFGGSSVGKSTILREMVFFYRITFPDIAIANIFLEENQRITPLAYIALAANIPLGQLKRNKELISQERQQELYQTILNTDKLMFINEDFERDSENLIKTIKYLAKVKKYDIIMLDHISYVIGRSKVGRNGERRDIDELLYALQDLARNLNIIIIFACHLSDPAKPPGWDEGRIPGLYNGRGSRVLAQVPDGIIGISRNMIDDGSCDVVQLHNLKNRWDSVLGKMDEFTYITSTGRLKLK